MMEMNLAQARFNMVEQQIRTWDVLDLRVLDVISQTPRDALVPAKHKNLAYADLTLPIGHGEETMFPKVEGHVLQALNLQTDETVLEIGTGSGCLTGLLAKMAKHVYSVDIYPDFLATAASRLNNQGITNVTFEEADAAKGWDENAPYHAIAVTGSVPTVPNAFKEALTIGGRLFVIVGEKFALKEALLITRTDKTTWQQKSLFETELAPLLNASMPPKFVF